MDGPPLDRRDFVKACILVGTGAALGVAGLAAVQQLTAMRPREAAPIRWPGGRPATVADLDESSNGFLTLEWQGLPASVLKVPVAALRAAAASRGINTGQYALPHRASPDHAIVAYEGKCTHLGCTVGFHPTLGASMDIPDYDADGKAEGRIVCPCHQAQFDHHDLGTNLPGTAGPRPLPVLRFRIEDGQLIGLERIGQDRRHGADRDGPGVEFQLGTQA